MHGIGLTNICSRTTRSSSDLSKNEIKAGAEELRIKLQRFRPKIIAFNGKGIYEVFSNRQKVTLGLQDEKFEESFVFVMPSSSPRAASYPTQQHKLPFYIALRKLRDHVRGNLPDLDFQELKFATGGGKKSAELKSATGGGKKIRGVEICDQRRQKIRGIEICNWRRQKIRERHEKIAIFLILCKSS